MTSRTIKISEENYRRLLKIASRLQLEKNSPASFDDAIEIMEEPRNSKYKGRLSDLAGAWEDISDKEWNSIKKNIKKGWKNWKIPSV